MYDDVPGISDILRDVLAFRYRLAPTFYSLYVTDYQRRGWPLLKVTIIVLVPLFSFIDLVGCSHFCGTTQSTH
jgi:hypothetical protein